MRGGGGGESDGGDGYWLLKAMGKICVIIFIYYKIFIYIEYINIFSAI